jgi:hypothetical protein
MEWSRARKGEGDGYWGAGGAIHLWDGDFAPRVFLGSTQKIALEDCTSNPALWAVDYPRHEKLPPIHPELGLFA